jgi:hypothetical protein
MEQLPESLADRREDPSLMMLKIRWRSSGRFLEAFDHGWIYRATVGVGLPSSLTSPIENELVRLPRPRPCANRMRNRHNECGVCVQAYSMGVG